MAAGRAAAEVHQAGVPVAVGKIKRKVENQKIEQAIAEFESEVDFEFVPVIAARSSYVEHISWMLSLIFLLILLSAVEILFLTVWADSWMSPIPFYLAVPFVAFALGVALDKSDLVDRFFISRTEQQRQVQEKAERVFHRLQLGNLKSHNALLLFVSVLERQIVLYPDPRLKFDKMPEISQKLLKILQESFKNKDYEAGIIESVKSLKSDLKKSFVRKDKSENIVPNKLIWWDE